MTNPAKTRETARSGLRLRAILLNAPPLDLRYVAVLQVDDPVDPVQDPEVVRSDQDRLAPLPALLHEDVHDLRPLLVVEVSRGLVGEYHGRVPDHPARDCGSLEPPPESSEGNRSALSARPTLAMDSRILFGLFARREVPRDEWDHDVLEHRQVADQEELLKHDADGLVPELLQVLLPER